MPTKKFTPEELYDVDWLERTLLDEKRWSLVFEYVFEHKGKFYAVEGEEPATEHQEVSQWGYAVTEVAATEVHQVPITQMTWVEVPD